jgi:hypothetical protein
LQGTSTNQTTIPGNANFIDYSTNKGTITGNAEFDNYAINKGTVRGSAIFKDNGYNSQYSFYNPITGAYQYNYVTGIVQGNADVYPTVPENSTTGWNYNFPLMGQVYGTITYHNGPLYYNNASGDGDWNNLANWWQTSAFEKNAESLPTSNTLVFITGDVTKNTGDALAPGSVSGGLAVAKMLYATATTPDVSYDYSSYPYQLTITTHDLNINIPITVFQQANFTGSAPTQYYDYTANQYINLSSPVNNNSNITTPKAVFNNQATNGVTGVVTGSAELLNNSINLGAITGDVKVYSPGITPIGGTVNGTTTYYNFTAPYTLTLTHIDQSFYIPVPIIPMSLTVDGPPVEAITYTLTAPDSSPTSWLNFDQATQTFTGTPTPQDNVPDYSNDEVLTINITANVPNYINYTYSEPYHIKPVFDITLSPNNLNIPLYNPPQAVTNTNISTSGNTPVLDLTLAHNSATFNYSTGNSSGLPTGLTYDHPTRTISGAAQIDPSSVLDLANNNVGYFYLDAYVVGSLGDPSAYYVEIPVNYTFSTSINIASIDDQSIGLLNNHSGSINIPITITGPGTLSGLTATGLPAGLSIAPDFSAIQGSISLPQDSLPNNTFNVSLIASDGYYTNIIRRFNIITTEIAIYPGQTISFFGRLALAYNVTVTVPMLNNYVWNDPVGLPDGVTLDKTTGIISGASNVQGTGVSTLSITLTSGDIVTGHIDWHVTFIPIVLNPQTFNITRHTPFNASIPYSGDIPYTWSYTGTLPSGISLDTTTGSISGTTTAHAGTYNIVVSASDPGGLYPTSQSYSISVAAGTTYLPATIPLTISVNGTLNYTIPYTGTPPDSWILITGNPAPFSFNTQTGVISGTAGGSPSVVTFSVAAVTDGINSTTGVLTINTIYPPPVIPTGQIFSGTRNSVASFQVSSTGGAITNWTSGTLPRGLSINPLTGVISGTPTQIGAFSISITGTGLGGSVSVPITINIAEILPVITPNQTFTFRSGLLIPTGNTIITTGGVPTSWSLTAITGASNITLNNSGSFAGYAPISLGSYSAEVTATNSAGTTAVSTITINVIVSPPIITQNQSVTVGGNSQISSRVQYAGGTPSSWSIANNPFGLNIDNTGLITGAVSSIGTFGYRVTAANAGGSSTEVVSIVVSGISPVIQANQTLNLLIGSSISLKIAYTGVANTWGLVQGSNLPNGVILNSSTGYITGTVQTLTGSYSSNIQVSNSYGYTSQTVNFLVYSIINQNQIFSGTKNTASSFTIATTGGTLANCALTSGNLPSGMVLSRSGVISGIPTTAGSFSFTVGAQTSYGFNTAVVVINIADIAPVIVSGQSFYLGEGAVIPPGNIPLTSGGTPSSWSILPIAGAQGISINSTTGEYIGFTPTALGSYDSYVTASNHAGSSASTLVVLQITPPKPILTAGQTITAGAYATFSLEIQYTGGTPSSWSIANNNYGLIIDNTGFLTGSIPVTGTFSYNVTATNAGGSSTTTISISISGVCPLINPGQTITANLNSSINYRLLYSGITTSWGIATGSNLPSGLSLNTNTGEIYGTPVTDIGSYTVAIIASNTYGYTTQNILILVKEAQPAITVGQSFVGSTYSTLSFAVQYTGGVPSSWAATGLPAGTRIDSNSGVISGLTSTSGVIVVLVTATNTGGSSSQAITLNIQSNAPALSPNQLFIISQGVFTTINLSHTGSNPAVWSASGLPTGMNIDSTSGKISGSVSITGNYTVVVTLQSPTYGSASGVILISVVAQDNTLMIVAGQKTTVNQGSSLSFIPNALGAPNFWSCSSAPSWLAINSSTGELTGTPTSKGTFDICIYAKDANNFNAAAFVTIYVV